MKGKCVILCAALTFAVSALTGCGESSKESTVNGVVQTNKSLSVKICETDEEYFKPAFDAYREAYPEVDLKVETFTLDQALTATEQMNTELMAGEGPDLLLMQCYGTSDVYKMLKAGVFTNLDEMIKADDTWKAEDYAAAVLDAGKFKGSQYVIPLSYDVMVAVGAKEGLENAGFPLDENMDTLSFLQQAALLYDTDYENRILAGIAMVSPFPDMLTGRLLDYENEKLNVDTETLQKACEAYVSMYEEDVLEDGDYGYGGYYGYGEQMAQEEAYFCVGMTIDHVFSAAGGVAGSATPVLIPMRTADGQVVARVSRYAGIRANSENQQNAYQLLRLMMGDEAQANAVASGYCPLLQKAASEAVDSMYEETQNAGDAVVEMGELDQTFIDEYRSYLLSPDTCFFPNNISISKFIDCMRPFYEGEEDFDVCLKGFEDYVKIYLSE